MRGLLTSSKPVCYVGKELVRQSGRSVGSHQSLSQPVSRVDRLSLKQLIILPFSDAVRAVDDLPMSYL